MNIDLQSPFTVVAIVLIIGVGYFFIWPLLMAYWWLILLGVGGAIAAHFYFNR